ncbi:AAA family ATPase [Occultella kanbiaonis]|uniref:AAA family ATPase n=1 Tax=Occultella kanbiaonis TaxID=2675754 RepID=UPI001E5796AF|nr:ATP-binding protein [Occultella kanbiaonis]
MGRVLLMCGPAGSGKSTLARALEERGLVRLSFDQTAWDRGLRAMPLPERAHREIESQLRDRLVTLVGRGDAVVLDFSFWSRRMRADYRALLRPLGVEPVTIHVATDRATALQRVRDRLAGHGDDFRLSEGLAAAYFDQFEAPTPDEGPLVITAGDDPPERQLAAIEEVIGQVPRSVARASARGVAPGEP